METLKEKKIVTEAEEKVKEQLQVEQGRYQKDLETTQAQEEQEYVRSVRGWV